LVTRGARGMVLVRPKAAPFAIPAFGSGEVADVTGAGDTVIATFTLALLAGGTPEEAAVLADVAAGLVVMKYGTATVTPRELAAALRAGPLP
ncbi:MAG TPA: PfkB family carbohydrate kinase, partial [Candidatus Polarisedimenticolaceae bacterium]|nr:PfkB family carbohydrate kinase [Candidatus Polarisedimenticolaceae bacterium]